MKKILTWPRWMPSPLGILWGSGEPAIFLSFRAYQLGKLRVHIPTRLGLRSLFRK